MFSFFIPVQADDAPRLSGCGQSRAKPPTIGDTLKKAGLKVAHFRSDALSHSARDTTVVYRPRQDERHTIEVSTAVCSEHDAFDRKQGTQLALSRFLTGQRVNLPPNKYEQSDYELLEGIFG